MQIAPESWPPSQARWIVRMLGPMDVAAPTGDRPKFRSRSVSGLLAYLCLHAGRNVSRFVLEETFWPDSESDKQSQNLRRAVADLRDALEPLESRGTAIQTQRDVVSASDTLITTDVRHFVELSNRAIPLEDEGLLAEAVAMYSGPLLAGVSDEWIYPHRLDFEERYAQCVDLLCRIRIEGGAAKDAVRLARAAVLAAPSREDVHIALIRGYRAAGLESEALRQYEDLERMMDETWGEPPSPLAKMALEGAATAPIAPISRIDRALIPPDSEAAGGALSVTSRFYIRRVADLDAERAIERGESVVLVQGPRQVGKSSLLARLLSYARERGVSTVLNDFQAIGQSQLADEERLYRTLAFSVASQLRQPLDLQAAWNPWLGPNMNLDSILGGLLEKAEEPVCWAMDEADGLFGRPYANDFFGLLRSWHNRRALDPAGPWSKLTLVLSYAAQAHVFITDVNQSPFNVGVRLALQDFSRAEVEDLAGRYGLSGAEVVDAAHSVAEGHPFLTRRALAYLSQGGKASDLAATCALEDGPFGDHLRWLQGSLISDDEVLGQVRNLLMGQPIADQRARYRLLASGVISVAPGGGFRFRVPAYEPFLRAALG